MLDIIDKDKYTYLLTYSFPCQDISNAGNKAGFEDTSTRSGMLWEVERILKECKELDQLPQVLLMENVPQVHSVDNTPDFNKWQIELTKLGYKNYWEDLIATDYGIPQTRNRCFMVSILGDYNYTFPKPIPLRKKLKDLLEDNVDEKYYLSDKMLEYITSKDDKYKVNENKLVINRDIACSKTTREGNTRADTTDYICDELPNNFNIKNGCKQIYDLNYYNHEQSNRVYSTEHSSPTLRTKCDDAGTIKVEICNLKIRKLTPKECFRLMGVKDEDFEKVAKNQSNASLYHLAGDSIVVNVLMAIFKNML